MTKGEMEIYLQRIENEAIHGKNILAKINNTYGERNSFNDEKQLIQFFNEYRNFREEILKLITNIEKNIDKIVKILNNYKNFVNKNNVFSAQSKYESTILEEFMFYLLKEMLSDDKIKYGSVNAYCNLYFSPKNLTSFLENPSIRINTKDQDFSIYRHLVIKSEEKEYTVDIPIIAIECKTYLDKTMLEGSISTAEKVKMGNPHTKFYIVTETYEVDFNVDIAFSRIDQIFVLRKQKRRGSTINDIYSDVILKLYNEVKNHLTSDWVDIENNINNNGLVK